MTARFDDLDQAFAPQVRRLHDDCRDNGTPMRSFFTLRRPETQAQLWRQSRTRAEVEAGIAWIRRAGAPWIADLIEFVGPQYGRWATNAAPGNSWHHWGAANDSFALVGGKQSWDTIPGQVGGPGDAYYRFYAERATELGLTSLGPTLGDWVHVQAYPRSAPSREFSWSRIEAEMRRRFAS